MVVEELTLLAHNKPQITEICAEACNTVLSSDRVTNEKEFIALLSSVVQSAQRIPSVFSCVTQRAADFSSVQVLSLTLPVCFAMYDEEQIDSNKLSTICLTAFKNLNNKPEKQCLSIISLLSQESVSRKCEFFKDSKTELQQTIYEYFTNKSEEIRKCIKELAFSSIQLYA